MNFFLFIDKNYEWIVCLGITIQATIRNIIFFSYGLFAAEFKKTYDPPMALLTWIMCIPGGLLHLLSPLVGLLRSKIKKNGNRKICLFASVLLGSSTILTSFVPHPYWMLLTFSFPHGIAYSLAFFSNSMVLMEYFPKNNKNYILASTFLYLSYPLSSLIFNPVTGFLLSIYSWQTTFLIFGIIMFLFEIPSSWLFKDKENKKESEYILENIKETTEKGGEEEKKINLGEGGEKEEKGMTINELKKVILEGYKDPKKIFWWIGNLISILLYLVPFFLLPHFLEERKASKSQVYLSLVFLSLGELLVYIGIAVLGQKLKAKLEGKLILPSIISFFFYFLVLLIWALLPYKIEICYILSFVFGSMIGVHLVFSYSCSSEITDLPMVVAWSSTSFFKGIGQFIMPIFSAAIYDVTFNYMYMFYFLSVLALICTIIHSIAAYYSLKNLKNISS